MDGRCEVCGGPLTVVGDDGGLPTGRAAFCAPRVTRDG